MNAPLLHLCPDFVNCAGTKSIDSLFLAMRGKAHFENSEHAHAPDRAPNNAADDDIQSPESNTPIRFTFKSVAEHECCWRCGRCPVRTTSRFAGTRNLYYKHFSFVDSRISDGDACDLSVIKKPTSSLIDHSLI